MKSLDRRMGGYVEEESTSGNKKLNNKSTSEKLQDDFCRIFCLCFRNRRRALVKIMKHYLATIDTISILKSPSCFSKKLGCVSSLFISRVE